ncbi:MAG: iron-containing redox enzyme family protein [Proteobacteria bacterium]|nr:iron-containing redox enzyme family protein [Pseudomonadota bacterium]
MSHDIKMKPAAMGGDHENAGVEAISDMNNIERPNRNRACSNGAEAALAKLRAALDAHPLWQNRLLKACARGHLGVDDLRFLFEQYYLYSKNLTRYLSALMSSCEDDLHRARLAQNLWEEGGMVETQKRHAEMFRVFLRDGLDIDLNHIEHTGASELFVREYLDVCRDSHPASVSAFLSLGTEAIVSRLYGIFVTGLSKAGVPDHHLGFFRLHTGRDDERAATIENIMMSYSSMPGWYERCYRAMDHALGLRDRLFDSIYVHIESRRIRGLLDKIRDRESLAPDAPNISMLHYRAGEQIGQRMYENTNDRLNIDFTVERVPFPAEVFDTRIVRIPAGKNNERHKHPHESVFYVMTGRARLHIDGSSVELSAGDLALVPRWAVHQTHNIGDGELVILALTDFRLTDRAFVGNHLKTTRMKGAECPHPG